MNCVSYQAVYEFINAWKNHDEAAARLSRAADVALKNGKPYYMPTQALKKETDAYVNAKEVLADVLGLNHVLLGRSLLDLHREGMAHEEAVRSVIAYLESLHEAS